MNIVEALVAHHATLRQLYRQAEVDQSVFEEFMHHLVIHHTMEEKYFYDILQTYSQAEHDALEAVNEHHIIEMIIKDADGFPRDHAHFEIKVEGLGEYTLHHLDEEEEEVFPLAEQLFSAEALQNLGALFEQAKKALLEVSLPELPKALASQVAQYKEKPGAGSAPSERSATSVAVGLGIGKL